MPGQAKPLSREHTSDAVVSIVAKRLDSDQEDETTVEIARIANEDVLRARLIDLVRARYPEAEFRSYAEGAASFLAPKVLIVAALREWTSRSRQAGHGVTADISPDHERQQQLFAA